MVSIGDTCSTTGCLSKYDVGKLATPCTEKPLKNLRHFKEEAGWSIFKVTDQLVLSTYYRFKWASVMPRKITRLLLLLLSWRWFWIEMHAARESEELSYFERCLNCFAQSESWTAWEHKNLFFLHSLFAIDRTRLPFNEDLALKVLIWEKERACGSAYKHAPIIPIMSVKWAIVILIRRTNSQKARASYNLDTLNDDCFLPTYLPTYLPILPESARLGVA